MEIRNRTIYDKELIIKYNKFYIASYLKKNFVIMSSITFFFIAYMLIISQWVYALVLLGILGFYLLMSYFMNKVSTNRILKRSPLVESPVLQSYVFRENDFDVVNIKKFVVEYNKISKIKKASEFFLLYSKERKTYIISYNGFENPSDKDKFEAFIKAKISRKSNK